MVKYKKEYDWFDVSRKDSNFKWPTSNRPAEFRFRDNLIEAQGIKRAKKRTKSKKNEFVQPSGGYGR